MSASHGDVRHALGALPFRAAAQRRATHPGPHRAGGGAPGLPRRIGLDLDNTIAGYDHVFRSLAVSEGCVDPDFRGGKREVARRIRAQPGGTRRWMALQGQAYGRCMPAAELLPGVLEFLERACAHGVELFVVSHRTVLGHFDGARIDLHAAARTWLADQGLFERGLAPERVFFHETREQKVRRIRELDLDLFVDDLLPVLTDEGFPVGTRRLHLSGEGVGHDAGGEPRPSESHGVRACADWSAVLREVFPGADAGEPNPIAWRRRVRRWLPEPGAAIEELRTGGNNRLCRVGAPQGLSCLKTFLRDARDPRDRFRAEREALGFLAKMGLDCAPRLLHACEEIQTLHVQWIEGEPLAQPTSEDVRQVVAFLGALHAQATGDDARGMQRASEACLSAAELIRQVEARFARLERVACLSGELASLLEGQLLPALATERERALSIYRGEGVDPERELAPRWRTLSPSDLGFHNALRRPGGELVFLDFEYFGVDDPVKLVSDFLLHPRHRPFPELRREFLRLALRLYGRDPFLRRRLEALHGLFALRWCGIVLNVFLPERRARMGWAGVDEGRTFERQLEQARHLLRHLHLPALPSDED